MAYVIAPPAQAAIPVAGSAGDQFPVRRVWCVGRNYAAHAREMGGDDREPPFFFAKPADALVPVAEGQELVYPYPMATADLHHEVELVVAIGKPGFQLSAEQANELIWGYAIGIDLTRRDRQAEAKKAGKPWEMGKAFDRSAPIGPLRPVSETGYLEAGGIALAVNGKARQQGNLADMIWPVADIIAQLSHMVALAPGDLIFTGTPEGVAAIGPGDRLEAVIGPVGKLRLAVTTSA
jgi:fumarylpyruvate hydrolase